MWGGGIWARMLWGNRFLRMRGRGRTTNKSYNLPFKRNKFNRGCQYLINQEVWCRREMNSWKKIRCRSRSSPICDSRRSPTFSNCIRFRTRRRASRRFWGRLWWVRRGRRNYKEANLLGRSKCRILRIRRMVSSLVATKRNALCKSSNFANSYSTSQTTSPSTSGTPRVLEALPIRLRGILSQ